MYDGEEREQNAKELCDDWLFALRNDLYNPFQDELYVLSYIEIKEMQISIKETEVEENTKILASKSEKDKRKEVSIYKALELFLNSRQDRTKISNTISTYRVTIKWLSEYFEAQKRLMSPISTVDHFDISGAIINAKRTRKWEKTTYNNEITNSMTIFNWLAKEYYITENPSKERIDKFPTNKSTKNWYTRDIASALKKALLDTTACQYTERLSLLTGSASGAKLK